MIFNKSEWKLSYTHYLTFTCVNSHRTVLCPLGITPVGLTWLVWPLDSREDGSGPMKFPSAHSMQYTPLPAEVSGILTGYYVWPETIDLTNQIQF